ncbi:MAG: 16S rRNA (cytosine(1402)-N(4))-methyltransferase [Candidatus Magasanikbacteria bacterium RIFCSPHIGHO2_01_FULL_41_23]|uniref:Ribosomal RNA small subunit methyltransferase H n=1 Tax=Candidatus Magasanikbacteria bacterium RIFCSPLOWO2_01_FULL_40_15 TaxID=1798686 RepID=A0A1F6N0I6_9BACT|nr:MAG: 16S rRNA (cytosine(1402)-N(4))-methyltransferase [Candidatus Magasanikbacteria bacterium RIFCSPHIGHO2_01_FULL_41_23]OGH74679.1 MAG: 16S rRNA (cytosine(1402)-N(4))-methyltransferase [Candidatus Magasanikbacteria bacterium RIFCSPHIGHO2_12_FULL_41_16]OGH77394.1 MAG: 16S rRNA (cytosine(1402)-N(4))-methyltransferase [Candidatus Magasanikbacteria bacterium RIFCSPLOWO2_01_FULL_40_15]
MRHIPVLLNEVLESLQLKSNDNVIDCTVGDGGHSEKILEATAPNGQLLAIDADPESLLRAKQYLYSFANRVTFVRGNFSELEKIVAENPIGEIKGILLDLGWSSPQFAERGRGFSFLTDEPLNMTYSGREEITATEIVNTFDANELEQIFREYGEENLSKEIVSAIISYRQGEPIKQTGQLTEIILATYRKKLKTDKEIPWIGGLHPATKIFQALRIAVNRELEVIEEVLPQAIKVLASGGRLAVITFHSLEDRIVKHYFKDLEQKNSATIITKKPIVCGEEEYKANPRARSAKLRVIQKN